MVGWKTLPPLAKALDTKHSIASQRQQKLSAASKTLNDIAVVVSIHLIHQSETWNQVNAGG